jgi:hypothetical protein
MFFPGRVAWLESMDLSPHPLPSLPPIHESITPENHVLPWWKKREKGRGRMFENFSVKITIFEYRQDLRFHQLNQRVRGRSQWKESRWLSLDLSDVLLVLSCHCHFCVFQYIKWQIVQTSRQLIGVMLRWVPLLSVLLRISLATPLLRRLPPLIPLPIIEDRTNLITTPINAIPTAWRIRKR